MSWYLEDLESHIGDKFQIDFHRNNISRSPNGDEIIIELQQTLAHHRITLVALHVQSYIEIGYSFEKVPAIDIKLDAAIWTDQELQLACTGADLLLIGFDSRGAFQPTNGATFPNTLKAIGNQNHRAPIAIAQDLLRAELEHLKVRGHKGNPWTKIRPCLRLLMALAPFRALCKLTYLLHYHHPKDKKQSSAAKFLSPEIAGYTIPNYDFELDDAAYSRAELAHVQRYFERNISEHPFVGASGIAEPEESEANASSSGRLNTLGTLDLPTSTSDYLARAKFYGYVTCFRFGPSRLEESLLSHAAEGVIKGLSRKDHIIIGKAAEIVKTNVTHRLRAMLLGLSSFIAGFGLPRFQRLTRETRIEGCRMLFRLAPYQCSLVMLGPQMDKCIDLAQIFDPTITGDQDLRKLLSRFVESQWCTTCEALFEHNIGRGVFNDIANETELELLKFFNWGFEADVYMGAVDKYALDNIERMPVNPKSTFIASNQTKPTRKTQNRVVLSSIDDAEDQIRDSPSVGRDDEQKLFRPGGTKRTAIELSDDEATDGLPAPTKVRRSRDAAHTMPSRPAASLQRQSTSQVQGHQHIRHTETQQRSRRPGAHVVHRHGPRRSEDDGSTRERAGD